MTPQCVWGQMSCTKDTRRQCGDLLFTQIPPCQPLQPMTHTVYIVFSQGGPLVLYWCAMVEHSNIYVWVRASTPPC